MYPHPLNTDENEYYANLRSGLEHNKPEVVAAALYLLPAPPLSTSLLSFAVCGPYPQYRDQLLSWVFRGQNLTQSQLQEVITNTQNFQRFPGKLLVYLMKNKFPLHMSLEDPNTLLIAGVFYVDSQHKKQCIDLAVEAGANLRYKDKNGVTFISRAEELGLFAESRYLRNLQAGDSDAQYTFFDNDLFPSYRELFERNRERNFLKANDEELKRLGYKQ